MVGIACPFSLNDAKERRTAVPEGPAPITATLKLGGLVEERVLLRSVAVVLPSVALWECRATSKIMLCCFVPSKVVYISE